jgi:hypothetical protein
MSVLCVQLLYVFIEVAQTMSLSVHQHEDEKHNVIARLFAPVTWSGTQSLDPTVIFPSKRSWDEHRIV